MLAMTEVDQELTSYGDEFMDPTDFELQEPVRGNGADRRDWTPPPDTDTKRRNKKTHVKIKHNRRDSKMRG